MTLSKKNRVHQVKRKLLIVIPVLAEGPLNRSLLTVLDGVEGATDLIILASLTGDLLSNFQVRSWKLHSQLNSLQLADQCERYAKRYADEIQLVLMVGVEISHLSQLFWMHDIPVLQWVDESPANKESIRGFNKYSRYMGVILFSSPEVKEAILEKCPDSSGILGYICPSNDPMQLSGLLKKIGGEMGERMKVEIQDRKRILGSDALDLKYAYPLIRREKKRAVARYTNSWITGVDRRKPRPGFHPGIYEEQCHVKGGDPFAHYLLAGKPIGPWSLPVIREPLILTRRRSPLKAALQIHLFYPEMSDEFIRRIKRSRFRTDLFISVPTEEALVDARRHFKIFTDRRVEIRMVPNRGRDIGPLLTEFASELQSYEVIGHIHTKKSHRLADEAFVDRWRKLLLENLIGGKKPMMDVILKEMGKNPKLGLVFPDDPNIIGWTKNRDQAQALLQRMRLPLELPERSLNFPVGTMFWARTAALQPLFDLKLAWSDYPEEPTPDDGTILHALERLLPFVAMGEGFQSAVTYVSGLSR